MKHIELTPRLRMVADMIPAGAVLADVGTDHAYLPAALMLEGKLTARLPLICGRALCPAQRRLCGNTA